MRRTQGMPSASSRAAVRSPIMPAPQMHTRSIGIRTWQVYVLGRQRAHDQVSTISLISLITIQLHTYDDMMITCIDDITSRTP